jgi:hypothetical protein
MKQLPKTANPLVIRTDFENQKAWNAICEILRAPVHDANGPFHAHVDLLEDTEYRDFTREELLASVPERYDHSFFLVVDKTAVTNPEFPILAVDLAETRGRSFRALPSQIQGIENNLSIANMGFEEFADAVDAGGIFRGFPKA